MHRIALFAALFLVSVAAFGQAAPEGAKPDADRGARQGGQFHGVMGTIAAISDGGMTLKTFDGKTVTVKLTDKTEYRKDRQPAKLIDFKTGDMVMVRGDASGNDTWVAQLVASRSQMAAQFREGLGKQFIAGEIKAIDGTKLTILRVDGQTQDIAVDETTSFRKQDENITLADLKPGDHVFGRGRQLKDGTFVPATLNVGEPGRMRRMRPGEELAPR